jgi:hypothetical protein
MDAARANAVIGKINEIVMVFLFVCWLLLKFAIASVQSIEQNCGDSVQRSCVQSENDFTENANKAMHATSA